MIHWRLLCALFAGLAIALPFPVGGELPTKSAVQSNHRFGLRLTTKLGLSQPDANVVVSPLLVQAALSLLYAGSTPESGRELRQALELTHASSPKEAVKDIQSLQRILELSASQTAPYHQRPSGPSFGFGALQSMTSMSQYNLNFHE